eukprot:1194098-Prorocentrum_minimum.AAC.3
MTSVTSVSLFASSNSKPIKVTHTTPVPPMGVRSKQQGYQGLSRSSLSIGSIAHRMRKVDALFKALLKSFAVTGSAPSATPLQCQRF